MDNALFKIVNFTPGSYITLEGERKPSPNFFIIKEGKVNLKRSFPVANEKSSEVIGPGDFFGVISAMSQYPQIESAIAMSNVTLISVGQHRFGDLIQKNSPLAMKIIRFFSKKLRDFDQGQSNKTIGSKVSGEEDLSLLYEMGENYFTQGNIDSAVYLFQSYLKYVPKGEFTEKAKAQLKKLGRPLEMQAVNGANRSYMQNQMIFSENEPGQDLFILQKGKVKITKIIKGTDVLLNIMKPGDIFGEMALLDNKPRSASAIAMEDADLLAINKANFESMVQTQPQLMSKIITVLSERVWNAYKKIANSMIEDMNGRIADMLLTIVEKNRVKIAPKAGYDFQLSIFDLLKMLGLTDRDTNLIMRFMTTNKFIYTEGDNLLCSDLALLDRLVHYHKEGKQRRT
ncbi:MAG TPA: cyclic nucleotide-binding domain-containing protein [Leptospiraceae bacterium]|nr:cyclic nucleotide-binding domain-containing protein [Leptospiraceae bacterium]HMW07649.1 cyclic nucleotide-binding domain-containing protein [Leptospiraceae bacterium]HMX33999.1 cyclic nucleotide-binding domain-containing protein [Leptospiraceae bacterium]HMY33232.1 cyclic nucleotide-binding domain-containing protein [Leptospiraceae bacterium]HMZ65738.1 cyclic nucleotide-binding domain-containing protein [Leptospiraceae bacterium]